MRASVDELRHFLTYYWSPREDDEWPFKEWEAYCQVSWDHAQASLAHIEDVLADPPDDLPSVISMSANLGLPTPLDADDQEIHRQYVTWLRACHERLAGILRAFMMSPRYLVIELLKRCWLGNDEQGAFEAFSRLQAEDPALVQRILDELPPIATSPPDDLQELMDTWTMHRLTHRDGTDFDHDEQARWFSNMIRRLAEYVARGNVYIYED
jgi:hypothetical protein